jgi:hypothetical protein
MDRGEQTTGTRDEQFNLVSVLYHALQEADTLEVYIFDAETSDDERLAAFFRETQAMHVQTADRAKELLGIPEAPAAGGIPPDAISGGIPPEEVPPEDIERGIPPDDISGGVPPAPGDIPPGGGPRVG